ncbi:hypothetical protein MPTK1_1g17190 [Marchantia polymorpha subsp. ruderalis]|uniref:Uncharacterized protein n=2 Tax=Marchantia polymorpha TaxID=3197 RepID=A0AAF6AR46_MARPO|nr:hypothetical protein MARPO_0001s0059 [Marchantia polymorpha]BBM98916.1 hypothetical protein Mp_1g17190 [Marchantia polymorpha subsp. ruderalis]|eukprot:PTQ49992.1 hypothetical protein MARPO_0001s0059 [Marchantia polymorpha]
MMNETGLQLSSPLHCNACSDYHGNDHISAPSPPRHRYLTRSAADVVRNEGDAPRPARLRGRCVRCQGLALFDLRGFISSLSFSDAVRGAGRPDADAFSARIR